MQKRTALKSTCLFASFLFLISLPGVIVQDAKAQEKIPEANFAFSTAVAESTSVYIDVKTIDLDYESTAAEIEETLEGALPIDEDVLDDPDNSFIKGLVEAATDRYSFGKDNRKAFINVAKDALIIVAGVGTTIVITGVVAGLSAIGAATVGTVLVVVLVTGAAVGLAISIGSIVKKLIKGDKKQAGADTFNFVRQILFFVAGARAGMHYSPQVSSIAAKAALSLDSKAPGMTGWLRNSAEPACAKAVNWFKDIPYAVRLMAKGQKVNACSKYALKNKLTQAGEFRVFEGEINAQTVTAFVEPSANGNYVVKFQGGAFKEGSSTSKELSFNAVLRLMQKMRFKEQQSGIILQSPSGKRMFWNKTSKGAPDEYIKIAGGNGYETDEGIAQNILEACMGEIRLNPDGSITKIATKFEGVCLGNLRTEADMMRIWSGINPNSSPKVLEANADYIKMTYLDGKPLSSYKKGELKLNPGAWERFMAKVNRFHDEGYIYADFDGPRNIMIVKGEIKLLDFALARKIQPGINTEGDLYYEMLGLQTLEQFIRGLGFTDLMPVIVPPEPAEEALAANP